MTTTSPRRLGVGLISAGWMGRLHSRAYLAFADKYADYSIMPDLVMVADPVKENAEAARRQFGYRHASADYRDVLARDDVDVVSICAPNYLHRDFGVAAAKAGKHFWIEKPMGTSRAQAGEVAAAAEAAGVVTAVGFTYRGAPAIERARQLIASDAIGRITNVRCRFDADYSAEPTGPRTWRYVRELAGSGVLGDLLSHGFDLAQYLVHDAITDVNCMTATFVPDRPEPGEGTGHNVAAAAGGGLLPVENEDYAALLARFGGGAVGTFASSRTAVGSRCDYSIEVSGTRGAIRWNFERMNQLDICAGPGARDYGWTTQMSDLRFGDFARFQPGAGMGLSFDDLKAIEGARFIQSVASGKQLAPSVADALTTANIAEAALASAQKGAWQAVAPPKGATTFDK